MRNVWNVLWGVEADMIIVCKRHLDRDMDMDGSGSCAGKRDQFNGVMLGTNIVDQRACPCTVVFYVNCSFTPLG